MYTGYFCPGHKSVSSKNKSYKVTSQNRTCILDIFALAMSKFLSEQKLQSYKPKLNVYSEIFCPDLQSQIKSYKVTSRNRTCILDFFALVRSKCPQETKATRLQAKIERVYWIFSPWPWVSSSQNKSYRVTSRNRTCMVKFFALTFSLRTKATELQAEIERVWWNFLPWPLVSE